MSDFLLPKIASGDLIAIDACIERYGGLVWSLARRLSPNATDAEDAVQEIFIDIWRNAHRFRPEIANESTFIALLARRRLSDRFRKLKRQLNSQSLDISTNETASHEFVPGIEIAEEASRALNCLEKLPSAAREVLKLSIYHGLPQSSIAEQTGIPLGTVKTHARRGLSQLRLCMEHQPLAVKEGGVSI